MSPQRPREEGQLPLDPQAPRPRHRVTGSRHLESTCLSSQRRPRWFAAGNTMGAGLAGPSSRGLSECGSPVPAAGHFLGGVRGLGASLTRTLARQEGFTGVTVFEKGPDLVLWLVSFPRVRSVVTHKQRPALTERHGERKPVGKAMVTGMNVPGRRTRT